MPNISRMRDFTQEEMERFPQITSMSKEQVRNNIVLWKEIKKFNNSQASKKHKMNVKASLEKESVAWKEKADLEKQALLIEVGNLRNTNDKLWFSET